MISFGPVNKKHPNKHVYYYGFFLHASSSGSVCSSARARTAAGPRLWKQWGHQLMSGYDLVRGFWAKWRAGRPGRRAGGVCHTLFSRTQLTSGDSPIFSVIFFFPFFTHIYRYVRDPIQPRVGHAPSPSPINGSNQPPRHIQ